MALATVDTQTAGDILRPAAYNGVVGLKPTYGRIARRGVMPVAWSIDTVGVQARDVADAAAVLAVLLADTDSADAGSSSEPAPDLAATLERPLHHPRIGVPQDELYARAEPEVRRHTEAILAALAGAGADVREVRLPDELALAHAAHRTVTFTECAALHEQLFDRRAREMGPKLRTLIELGLVTPAVSYVNAQRVRARFVTSVERALREVDVLITPTASGPAPDDLDTTGDSSFQIPWTFGGFPAISIPTGLSAAGLPLAIQLVGPLFGEQPLLRVAHWCEQALAVELPEPPETSIGTASR
jgi:Asp-tRNA(Asn)/Glu-tRNA(Gln) amidotransferase A subunit family amidase